MSIFELLTKDHNKVRAMLDEMEQLTESAPDLDLTEATRVVEALQLEIEAHNSAEEDIFYEALREKDEINLFPDLGYEEHQIARNIIEELMTMEFDNMQRAAKMKALKDVIVEHVEEEESQFFETARSLFSEEELDQLGQQFLDRKQNIANAA
jgi:hemerythrin-like domain-containing protein